MLNLIIQSDNNEIIINSNVSGGTVIFFAVLVAAFYIAFYVLRSIGIYKLAKNQGVENAFIAWIPCVWMYTACKIIGKGRFFGFTAENAAVWVCVVFSVATIVPLASNFLNYFPYVMYYLQGGEISIVNGAGGIYLDTGSDFINHFDTYAVILTLRILSVLGYLLRIAEIFLTVTVYIALFKKFWPEHYILAAVLSFFGLFPIFAFAIRDKKAVDFNEYIRRRYYGAGFTPYGNRYYGERGNPYGQSNGNAGSEPFGEFDNRPDEPFGEFSDGGKKGNGGENGEERTDRDGNDDYFQ